MTPAEDPRHGGSHRAAGRHGDTGRGDLGHDGSNGGGPGPGDPGGPGGGDPGHDDMAPLTGAYALNALPADELARFESHLATCAECGREVRGFLATTALLAEAVAVDPPAGLRDRVMAAVANTAQVAAPPSRSTDALPPPVSLADRRRRWPIWIAPAVAAACLLVAVVLGGVAIHARQQLASEKSRNRALTAALAGQRAHDHTVSTILASNQARTQKITAVLAAVDAHRISGKVTSGGRGIVVVSRSRGSAVVVASGVATLPSRRTYQLWLIGKSGARSAGFLTAGTGQQVLVTGVGKAGTLAMTVEPAGGTAQPTTTPILAITLPRS